MKQIEKEFRYKRFDLPFPMLDEKGLYGPLGELAIKAAEGGEPPPSAVMLPLLVGVGNIISKHRYHIVKATWHRPLLYAIVAARTGLGVKGAAWDIASELLRYLDPLWFDSCLMVGQLTTSEGLMYRIRDPIPGKDPGIGDKRLFAMEEEG